MSNEVKDKPATAPSPVASAPSAVAEKKPSFAGGNNANQKPKYNNHNNSNNSSHANAKHAEAHKPSVDKLRITDAMIGSARGGEADTKTSKQKGMATVENTLNYMTGDISYADLTNIEGISTLALKAKSNSSDVSIFQKKDYASILLSSKSFVVSYQDLPILRRFISETGRIVPVRISTLSRTKQKQIERSIKIARFLGLLPYVEY